MKKINQALLGSALVLGSVQASALPFSGYDARSLGMGGTGVAAGSVVNAATFNPALLAMAREDEDFNLSLAVGVVARDEDDMIGAVDDLQATNSFGNNLVDQFSADINAYIASQNAGTAAAVQTSANDLKTALSGLSNKPIDLGAVGGVNLSIPGNSFGLAIFGNSRGIASGSVNVAQVDLNAIDQVVSDVIALNPTTDPFVGGLTSTLDLRGGIVTEAGVALGMKLFGIAIGFTPKTVQIDTLEQSQALDSANTSIDNTGDSFSDSNYDIGVGIELGALRIGAVGKNMMEQEYQISGSSSVVKLEPQLRAGIAFDAGWATIAVDQDLTENKGIITTGVAAIDDANTSQFTSVGLEFDMSLVQLRVGMRSDNTGNTDDVITAGIGIHALMTVDIAVASNDQGLEAIVQAGIRW